MEILQLPDHDELPARFHRAGGCAMTLLEEKEEVRSAISLSSFSPGLSA
jgi:hypothetical protein